MIPTLRRKTQAFGQLLHSVGLLRTRRYSKPRQNVSTTLLFESHILNMPTTAKVKHRRPSRIKADMKPYMQSDFFPLYSISRESDSGLDVHYEKPEANKVPLEKCRDILRRWDMMRCTSAWQPHIDTSWDEQIKSQLCTVDRNAKGVELGQVLSRQTLPSPSSKLYPSRSLPGTPPQT